MAVNTHSGSAEPVDTGPDAAGKVWTSLGVMAAILASSCCILPFAFVLLGVGGAWMSQLTSLEPYKFYFIAGAAICLAFGFRRAYFRKMSACDVDGYCASNTAKRVTTVALWLGSALVVASATVELWAPLLY